MNKVRALIIDDSSVMRKIVARSLRQAGVDLGEVREAGNGVEALAAITAGVVDLILNGESRGQTQRCPVSGKNRARPARPPTLGP
jgi:chemotaxis response regulator CheB